MSAVLQALLAATALADQIMTMVSRYEAGDMSDEELMNEWKKITSRVGQAEAIMAKARQLRAERGG